MSEVDVLKRMLRRERVARKEAEKILEDKSRELFSANEQLTRLNTTLEKEIQDRVNKLEQNEKRYQNLVESVSDIIYKTDDRGRFTYVNATTERITGYSAMELIGEHFNKIVRDDHRGRVIAFYIDQFRGKSEKTYQEFPIVTKSGREIWIGQHVNFFIDDNDYAEFLASGRDITKIKMAEIALVRSEEKYRGIIENLELGLMEVDEEGYIIKAYPKFCELTGYKSEELVGNLGFDLLLPPESQKFMRAQIRDRREGDSAVYEIQLMRKDGSLVWVMISAAPFYDENNNHIGSLGIHLDITNRKMMEQELIQAKEVAENSVRSKELFMANMSHEIRTPMNAIIGITELVSQTELTKKQEEYLNIINSSASSLILIINDILDFSKIESGLLELEKVPIDLLEVARKAASSLMLNAKRKGIELSLKLTDDIEKMVLSDPVRINQVLLNLLSNAVKFTHEGGVTLEIDLIKETKEDLFVSFKVSDTGIGISKENQKKVFESFVQAEESTTRNYGGTGLGLPISQQLVKLLGGELEVKSTVGKGSTFSFSLLLTKCDSEVQIEPNKGEELSPDLQGTKVLIVEDHEINMFMAVTILEQWSCQIDQAGNGMEAIEKVRQNTYDIILMDVRMPEMNGIEATKYIREDLKIKTPIIALTANAIKGDNEDCFDAGMNDYVSKPFKQEDLLACITKHLSVSPVLKSNAPAPKQEIISENEQSLVDLTGLKGITKGNSNFMNKMINLFIKDTPLKLETMLVALRNQDYPKVSAAAHKLKPSLDSIAKEKLRKEVRAIEAWDEDDDSLVQLSHDFIASIRQLLEELSAVEA